MFCCVLLVGWNVVIKRLNDPQHEHLMALAGRQDFASACWSYYFSLLLMLPSSSSYCSETIRQERQQSSRLLEIYWANPSQFFSQCGSHSIGSAAIFDFCKNMNHIFVNAYQNLRLIDLKSKFLVFLDTIARFCLRMT